MGTLFGVLSFTQLKRSLFLIFIPILFGLILASQVSTGSDTTDIYRYFIVFNKLHDYDILKNLSMSRFVEESRIFHYFSYLIKEVLSVGGVIYLWMTMPFCLIFLMIKSTAKNNVKMILVMLIVQFIGIMNFPEMGEWQKQNNAVAILFFAMMLIQNKSKPGWGLLALAFAFHYSMLPLLPLVIFSFIAKDKKTYIISLGLAVLLSFWDFNQVVKTGLCTTFEFLPKFGCARLDKFSNFQNWKITAKQHLSYFLLLNAIFFPSLVRIFNNKAILIERFSFLYLLFLIANLSNAHNFIRFLWSAFPVGAVGLIYFFKENKFSYRRQVFAVVALLFIGHNIASLYMRTHRPTYQSEYAGGKLTNLFTYNIFDYWKLVEGPKKK